MVKETPDKVLKKVAITGTTIRLSCYSNGKLKMQQ